MKNIFSRSFWGQRDMELLIGKFLRYGVFTACGIAILGGILYLIPHGQLPVHYTTYHSEPDSLRGLFHVLQGVCYLDGQSIIQFGVAVLIATPIGRVFFSIIAFAMEKDRMYTIITVFVFAMILFSLLFGIKG